MMRWCCSMFKTGPITRVINSLYRNQQILTFYGIRKSESVSRSKYNRIEDDAESVKSSNKRLRLRFSFGKTLIFGSIFCLKRWTLTMRIDWGTIV